MKKIKPSLIEKYDIKHRIIKELTNLESRHILFSIIKKPKDAQEISNQLKIPISTTYKKIHNMLDLALISEVEVRVTDNGKVVREYQSKITDVQISISKFEPTISFNKNPNVKK